MRKSNTYFEQISVVTVKRIVEQLPEGGISTQEDWRQLAERVQQETDPNRMIDLVQQLITKLDEQKLRKGLTPAWQPNGNAAE